MIVKDNSLIISSYKSGVLLVFLIMLNLLSGCVTQRDVEYLQDKDKNVKAFDEAEFPDYKLKSNDELYIQVNSLDEAAASVFSDSREQIAYIGSIQPYGASLLSYSVDKEGYLLLPVIGKIFVIDKTVSEVSAILKDSLSHILNQPIISVKLVNRFISIMGEVRNPGHFPYSQDKLSIYDGLGLAGDITDYGNRESVILVRNENGKNLRINVNLKQSDMLASDYYYLRPNDIVYVKPLKQKFWQLRTFPWGVFFSAITTGLLIYEIVNSN